MSKIQIEATIDIGEIESPTLINAVISRIKQHNKGWLELKNKQPMDQWSEERKEHYSNFLSLKNKLKKVLND